MAQEAMDETSGRADTDDEELNTMSGGTTTCLRGGGGGGPDCQGFLAWQRLHRKYNPGTMARAMRLMIEVTSLGQVKHNKDVGVALTTWEDKVRQLGKAYLFRGRPGGPLQLQAWPATPAECVCLCWLHGDPRRRSIQAA